MESLTEKGKALLNACVEKDVENCRECGASFDEFYLYNKFEKRLNDYTPKGLRNLYSKPIDKQIQEILYCL